MSGRCYVLLTAINAAPSGTRRHVVAVDNRVLTKALDCAEGQQEAYRSVKKNEP